MQLRDYQIDIVRDIYGAWSRGSVNVLAQLATGAGKTVVMSKVISDYTGNSIAIAHRVELVGQISLMLARFGIRHNIVAQKQTVQNIIATQHNEFGRSYYDPHSRCVAAGVDTLIRLPPKTPWFNQVGLVVIDEAAHVLRENKWGSAASLFPHARGLYPTATPIRADGKGLGRHADGIIDEMVHGPCMRELILAGHLSEYRIFAPPSDLDLTPVPISASGDYSPVKLRTAVHKSHITGDIVSHYLRIAPGKLGITFAVDIESATEIAREFRRCGVTAEVVSSNTPDLLRNAIMKKFRNREVMQLVNVDILGEGVDVPAVEVVSMGRPTQSYGLFAQQFGRALRPSPGKTCVARGTKILTHMGEVSIEDVTLDHLLWDGVSFVNHSGAVCMGTKKTIDYKGLSATPDHKVMTSKGWVDFEKAIIKRIRIIKTGVGGVPLRYFGDSVAICGRHVVQIKSFSKMQNLREPIYAPVPQYEKTNPDPCVYQLQCSTKNNVAEVDIPKVSTTTFTVHQSKSYRVPKLWGEGYTVSIPYGKRCVKMGSELFRGSKRYKKTIRQNRQRWALRTGKSQVGYGCAKLQQLKGYSRTKPNKIYGIPKKLPFCKIRRFNPAKINIKIYRLRNNKQMEFTVSQTEREVWDILNSGALQRFTASGYLVHNCAIIMDHVNNVQRHGLPDAPRIWTLDRRDRRSRGTPDDVIPLKTCIQCMAVFEKYHRNCPFCGHFTPPAVRSSPEFVDGDLLELDVDILAKLRGEVARVDGEAKLPGNVEPYVQRAIANRHAERQEAQRELRANIAQWAGYRKHDGDSDSVIYRRFFTKFGVDILTAQTLNVKEAQALTLKVIDDMVN